MTGPLVADELHAHLVGQDERERRLAQARRTAQKHVVERLAALPRGLDEDAQVVLVLGLPDVVGERARTQRAVELRVVAPSRRVDGAIGGSSSLRAAGRFGIAA